MDWMNRETLQKMTAMRLSDAKWLLKSKRNNPGAYYMAGYVVECAIKACITRKLAIECAGIGRYPFPLKIRNDEYFSHNLITLVKTAGLSATLKDDRATNLPLDVNWSTVTGDTMIGSAVAGWDESKRYDTKIRRKQAEDIINAIEDPKNGVLIWLKNYW